MASTFISRTFSGTYNSGTISMWLKRSNIGSQYIFYNESASDSNDYGLIQFDSSDRIEFMTVTNGTHTQKLITNRVFRDTSSFYHFVFSSDTDNSTATNRLRIYVNGEEETSFATDAVGSQGDTNYLFQTSATNKHRLFASSGGSACFSGLATHIHIVPNSQLAPTVFGETDSTSGIWKPKTAPSVTYTAQGAFLKFENSGNLDLDSSGNNLTFTTSGTLTQNVDTPSNVFATLNGINAGGGNTALSNGNLTYTRTDYSHNARSTLGFTKGKWYWEQKISDVSVRIGLITSGFTNNLDTDSTDAYYGTYANGGVYLMNSASGTSWQATNNDTSRSITTYTSAIGASAGDILMGAVDADAGKLWLGVNGTWMNSGDPAAGSNNQITFTNSTPDELQVYAGFGTSNSRTVNFNFGSGYFGTTAVSSGNADANGFGTFEYAVPSGYYAICTKNIKEFG